MIKKKINPAFGQRLSELRQDKGLSQSRLADAAGMPVRSLQELEQGRREPLLSAFMNLCKALDATLEDFPFPIEE